VIALPLTVLLCGLPSVEKVVWIVVSPVAPPLWTVTIFSDGSLWVIVRVMDAGAGSGPKSLLSGTSTQTPEKFGLAWAPSPPVSDRARTAKSTVRERTRMGNAPLNQSNMIFRRCGAMSGVRVLVGTRKGAFILTSDGKRERWQIDGP